MRDCAPYLKIFRLRHCVNPNRSFRLKTTQYRRKAALVFYPLNSRLFFTLYSILDDAMDAEEF